jgi:hypothetical protein
MNAASDRVMSRAIGGFLPLRFPLGTAPAESVLAQWTRHGKDAWMLHNARSALHALWSQTKPRRIWLPAYVCPEVLTAVPAAVEARYYPLSEALLPRIDYLSEQIADGDHVLVIDYFGRPPTSEFVSLARDRPGVGWLEDCAQALDPPESAWADWLLYSPRKLLGVPDGGLLVASRATLGPLATLPLTDFAFALPSVERFEDFDETDNARWYGKYVAEENALGVGLQQMSRLSLEVLKGSDLRADSTARHSNYRILYQRLREWAFFPQPQISFTPLGFPVRVKSAHSLAKRLSERRIFAARHWSRLPSDRSLFAMEHRLAEELLTLPCDYRYGEPEMHRVADIVLEQIALGA